MIAVYDVLRRASLLFGTDGDRHAVLVRASDENHIFVLGSQISHIDVGRDIDARQMPYMHRAVGVWQGRCHRGTLEFTLHFYRFFAKLIYSPQFCGSRRQMIGRGTVILSGGGNGPGSRRARRNYPQK